MRVDNLTVMTKSAYSVRALATYFVCLHLLAGGTGLQGGNAPVSKRVKRDATRIKTAALREELTYIASDELAGRDTPSPGLEKASEYIERHLKRWGIEPAGAGGTYRQSVPIRIYRRDPVQTSAQFAGRDLILGKDYTTPEMAIVAGSASGGLVYVGSGFIVKSKGINPYASVDVRGKIIISTGLLPPGLKQSDLQGQPGNDWMLPPQAAKQNGAVGVIPILSKEQSKRFPAAPSLLVPQVSLRDGGKSSAEKWLPTLLPSEELLQKIFENEQVDATRLLSAFDDGKWPEPFALSSGKSLRFSNTLVSDDTSSVNVIAKITGSDSKLNHEYIVLGAHYDHVGTGIAEGARFEGKPGLRSGDNIYNGADDDGSGTVGILELARAIKQGKRMKRSVLFVWHSGEERGLLGSRYLVAHPPVPQANMIAELQFDMIGRTRTPGDKNPLNEHLIPQGYVFVEGDGVVSSDLGQRLREVNDSYLRMGLTMGGDPARDPAHFFFRSDNAPYSLANVPTLQFHDGEHEDYHRPSDTVDKIDFPNMERILQTTYALIQSLGNSPQAPLRDRPLTPEQKAIWNSRGL